MKHTLQIETEQSMKDVADTLVTFTKGKRLCVLLEGDLGAGKTTWMRYYLRALGYKGHVVSPTYTLLEEYDVDETGIVHSDCYRLSRDDLFWLDFNSYHESDKSYQLWIEWGKQYSDILPPCDLLIEIKFCENLDSREMVFSSPIKTYNWANIFRS
tara:strand:+ start:5237 stop:5704 length:468 start_codon:yes stop_codon:yes gene_type:complete